MAKSLDMVGEAIIKPGGKEALRMKLVEQYIDQLSEVIEGSNVSIFPAELATFRGIVEELRRKTQPIASAEDR